MSYGIVYTDRMAAELAAKIDYLREHNVSEQTIASWFDGLYDRIESLHEMPRVYGLDQAASKRHGHAIRKLTYKKHIVRYRVDESGRTVYVLSFIHGARRNDA